MKSHVVTRLFGYEHGQILLICFCLLIVKHFFWGFFEAVDASNKLNPRIHFFIYSWTSNDSQMLVCSLSTFCSVHTCDQFIFHVQSMHDPRESYSLSSLCQKHVEILVIIKNTSHFLPFVYSDRLIWFPYCWHVDEEINISLIYC